MLSQVLPTRTRQHITSIFRLHLHQHFNHTLISTSEEKDNSRHSPTPVVPEDVHHGARIRTWEPIHNLADAWALLRVVERKYGKILEAGFVRDFEFRNRYQVFLYVSFLDPRSVQRISQSGDTFHTLAPNIAMRPGGLGLEDIRHLLDSVDIEESSFESPTETNPTERIIGGYISPYGKYYLTNYDWEPVPDNHWSPAITFYSWGGFHKLEPIKASSNIEESDWFTEPYWKQVRMRAAMQWCSERAKHRGIELNNDRKLTAHESDGIVSDSSPAPASTDSPESSSPTTPDIPISHELTSKSTQSCSVQAELPQPPSQSSPVLDIPISHELTSKSTQSPSVRAELPQPPSQSSPVLTQLPPEQIPPEPTIPSAGQLTPEQKETMRRQMSKAKELKVKTKQSTAKKTRKPEKEPKEEMPKLDKSPEDPLELQSKSVIASFWKFLGR